MKKRIVVTKKDIDNGIPLSHSSCPIALAAKRAFPGKDIFVGSSVCFSKKKFPLPEKGTKFVMDFDRGYAVQPFQFVIDTNKILDYYGH
jgi:hypothetical protein